MIPRALYALIFAALGAGCALIAGVKDAELRPGSGGSGQGGATTSDTTSTASAIGGGGATSGGVGGMVPGMANVPGATYMMGCNDVVDAQCATDEDPYHEVTLTGFRIDVNEVTRGDYFAYGRDLHRARL